ncbi:Putative ABC transport system membrane protein [Alloactinosynnema sp. L-07]|uniref:ABC transporter permease subunit n=1 Tax=Alloactinosynnema sp. L-07 TaxID=1653480 RepID=UPI00065F09D7|nr:ABC transporter permease subunit [Alloactinosynnema sp. L-07]CRK59648.1 Putative ABC transport system membrane protein [Alloactinosynnema sp. L-07]
MGNMITAEFRKILTTRLWWALLIPAFLLAFGAAWGWSAVTTGIANDLVDEDIIRDFDVPIDEISWSVIALVRGMNIASIFPMVFGALGLASELHRKTITTSFLTAASRPGLLAAKGITYTLWGVIYGLVISGGVTIGALVGSDKGYLPDAKQWFLVMLAGVIMCTLWTLFALGVGALIGSPVGTLVILLIYTLIVGPFGEFVLFSATEGSHAPGFLPNGAANGLTGSTASILLFDQIQTLVLDRGGELADQDVRDGFHDVVSVITGAYGAFSLWISGLIFFVWTAVFFVTGMLRNQSRDIT